MNCMQRCARCADMATDVVRTLFVAGSITCLLLALHRIAAALKLGARVQALDSLEDAFTTEEREAVIRGIKARALRGL